MRQLKKYKVLFLMSLLAVGIVSCSKENLPGTDSELTIGVRMSDSAWTTRAAANTAIRNDTVDISDDLALIVQNTPIEQRATRGTLVPDVSKLGNIGIFVFNTVNADFSASSVRSETLVARYSSGAWLLQVPMLINSDNKYTYLAYSPVADASNGITVASNSRSLTYKANTDVTKQPDLCWATPRKNFQSGDVAFTMEHKLTAVGVKVSADNLEVSSIIFKNVYTSATLNLESGAWTALGTKTTLSPKTIDLTNYNTNAIMKEVTATDGYLMLPPQSFSDDALLLIKYRYTDDPVGVYRESTHRLSGLSASSWVAGQKVTYNIQFKAKFSISLNPSSKNVTDEEGVKFKQSEFSFTTNNPALTGENAPTVTCPEEWVTGITVTSMGLGNHKVTFNYALNPTAAARKALFTVTSGYSTATFTLTQLKDVKIDVTFTPDEPASIPMSGGEYTAIVETPLGVTWKATTTNCTVTPSSGVGGKVTVKVRVLENQGELERPIVVNFAVTVDITNPPTKNFTFTQETVGPIITIGTTKWLTRNLDGIPSKNTGIKLVPKYDDRANFFKWGQYKAVIWSQNFPEQGDEIWKDGYGASATPERSLTNQMGYDYEGLSNQPGASSPGDPCLQLGPQFRTPTRAQFKELMSFSSMQIKGTLEGDNKDNWGICYGPQAALSKDGYVAPGCIFLPFGGCRTEDGLDLYRDDIHNAAQKNTMGCYWTSTVSNITVNAYAFIAAWNAGYDTPYSYLTPYTRSNALQVRCVLK